MKRSYHNFGDTLAQAFDLNWSTINKFGQSSVLKSSFIWISVVPILAKALDGISHIEISGYKIDIELPFSWKMFFLAACSFAVATAIYWIRCPVLNKSYKDYAEFEREKQTSNHIFHCADEVVLWHDPDTVKDFLPSFHALTKLAPYGEDIEIREDVDPKVYVDKAIDLMDMLESSPGEIFSEENHREAFWLVRNFSETLYPRSRKACLTAYYVGFGLLGLVMLQNVWFVMTKIF